MSAGGNRVSLSIITSAFLKAVNLCTWILSGSPCDDFLDCSDIVLKQHKWRRGTSPRVLDLLLEIYIYIYRRMHRKKETVAG